MSENVGLPLSDDERAVADALFEQLDIEMPHELEWDGYSRVAALHVLPDLGVEMRYNVRAASYDQSCFYHYWTYTLGENSLTMVVAQDSPEYLRETAEPGESVDDLDEPSYTPLLMGTISRKDILEMDAAGVIDLDSLIDDIEPGEFDWLDDVVDYWVDSNGAPDSIWLFLSHHLLGSLQHQSKSASVESE